MLSQRLNLSMASQYKIWYTGKSGQAGGNRNEDEASTKNEIQNTGIMPDLYHGGPFAADLAFQPEMDIYENREEDNADIVREYAHSNEATMLVSSYNNTYRETDIVRLVMKLYNNSNTNRMIGYVVCDIDSKIFRYRMEKFIKGSDIFLPRPATIQRQWRQLCFPFCPLQFCLCA